jgi:hypothetical protein
MRPDVVTTLPDERLLQPRELRSNPGGLLKPFGRYARFLVRTGLVVRERGSSPWEVRSPIGFQPIARWLGSMDPASAVVMCDKRLRIVAVHRAKPGFEDPAGRMMVLSATTGAGQAFLVESSVEEAPTADGAAAESLRRARERAACSPVSVLDLVAVGRDAYASQMDDWNPITTFRGRRDEELPMFERLENEFDSKVVLARSSAWRGKPGPQFSRKLLAEACKHMEEDDQESMVGLSFDGEMRLVAIHEAARGAADNLTVSPRDLLKVPILTGADRLAIVHNHPSGRTEPSNEDYIMAEKLAVMARCVGVRMVGSFVVGRDGEIEGFALEGTP